MIQQGIIIANGVRVRVKVGLTSFKKMVESERWFTDHITVTYSIYSDMVVECLCKFG